MADFKSSLFQQLLTINFPGELSVIAFTFGGNVGDPASFEVTATFSTGDAFPHLKGFPTPGIIQTESYAIVKDLTPPVPTTTLTVIVSCTGGYLPDAAGGGLGVVCGLFKGLPVSFQLPDPATPNLQSALFSRVQLRAAGETNQNSHTDPHDPFFRAWQDSQFVFKLKSPFGCTASLV